jgi:type IV pilus assembly protein PilB
MNIDPIKLRQGLLDHKVDQATVTLLEEEAKSNNKPFYELVKERHVLPDEELGKLIAEAIGYPYMNLAKVEIPSEVLEIVPENIALKQGMVTFGIDEFNNRIRIATVNPFDLELIHDIEKKTGREAEVFYTTEAGIKNIIGRYNKELKHVFLNMLPPHLRYVKGDADREETRELTPEEQDEVPIVKILDAILLHAYRHHASDIHIEATRRNTILRYRIDGVLHKIVAFPRIIHEPLVTRCKILASLRIDETRAAQDGRIQTRLDNDNVAFRVSVLPTHFGEKIVLRLLAEIEDSVNLMDSGLSEADYKKVILNATKPYGMMIVTGPTGSGKTTTLYSIIKLLNSEEINIATIEDPIEYGIEGINQVQVNHATNLTFANGLRALLRQDPDSILIGEIRDQETAQIGVESAMTGHMVFSTLHANSAAVGIPRLVEMGMEPFLLTAAINCLIAQRLVRKLCTHCMQSQSYSKETLALVYQSKNMPELVKKISRRNYTDEELERLEFKDNYLFYKGMGCKACGHTGYKGRLGLYEVLEMNEAVKKVILEGGSSDAIEEAAVKTGMTSMLENGIEKALSGLTSLEEVIRVIKS